MLGPGGQRKAAENSKSRAFSLIFDMYEERNLVERLVIHGAASHAASIGPRCDSVDVVANGIPYRLIIDAGLEMRADNQGSLPPDLSLLNIETPADAGIITHSHLDHIGSLAHAVGCGYFRTGAPLYMSPQSARALPILLNDGLSPYQGYDAFDAAKAISQCRAIPAPGETEILPGLKVFFAPSGHIPGAFSVVIPTSRGTKGLITGDSCWHDQPVIRGAGLPSQCWPKEWIPDEIWGTDLTYGFSPAKKPSRDQEIERFIAETERRYLAKEKVIVLGFANGRAQNAALWLSRAGIPVWLDGSARDMYRIFSETRWSERDKILPSLDSAKNIRPIESQYQRQQLLDSPSPCVIITTGGMGDFGPAVYYLQRGLERTDVSFFFTSWLAPGTNGEKLMHRSRKNAPQHLEITDHRRGTKMKIPITASIEQFGLSAHGSLEDFIFCVQDIVGCRNGRPLDRVVLTHGTPETKRKAAEMLMEYALTREVIYGERNTVVSLDAPRTSLAA